MRRKKPEFVDYQYISAYIKVLKEIAAKSTAISDFGTIQETGVNINKISRCALNASIFLENRLIEDYGNQCKRSADYFFGGVEPISDETLIISKIALTMVEKLADSYRKSIEKYEKGE